MMRRDGRSSRLRFLKIPSIVAVRKPTSDTLVDGVTGLAVPPRDAEALASAIAALAADRGRAATDGRGCP